MGSCFSCRLSSSSSSSSDQGLKTVRVVHLSGHVEDFEHPLSVSHITGNPTKHFVFTPAQLLTTGSKPMRPETLLEPGRFYFLLPYSALQADVSPLDLASVAKRLSAIAKTDRSKPNKSPGRFIPSVAQYGGASPVWSSPARSPNRFAEPVMDATSFIAQRSPRVRPWKPILDTIRERSFHRRSESELQLQENQIEALNVG